MRIVGFVGPSGTGKSHRSLWVAKERGVDCIIDDGLLIMGSRVIAGTSAKKESTRIGSIKRALFVFEDHVEDVKKALYEYHPEALMILGTSDGMVETIAQRLGFDTVHEKVYIHEVADEFEIRQALATRKEQGKHVIPVPTFEIKKDFSGYMLDPLQIFKRKGKANFQIIGEKSVVRPTFSYMGNYTISDYTIYQIIEHVATHIEGVHKITRFRVENHSDGIHVEMDFILKYGCRIKELLHSVQINVKQEVERLTALNIKALNVIAKSLIVDSEKQTSNE